jgi:dihydrofolate reductase
MSPIRVHEFISLDGVIDTPTWTAGYGSDPAMGDAIGGCMLSCQGILLGRKTYDMFEPAWSVRTAAEDPGAPFMNDTMKYVVSATHAAPTWANSGIIGGYDPKVVAQLKEDVEGGLYVSGSGTLVRAMIEDNLVDELHLFIYPLSRGSGPRLFADGMPPSTWTRSRCEGFSNGVTYLELDLVG